MRISDWSSDVCSSDLENTQFALALRIRPQRCGSAFKNEPDVVTQIDVQPWMLQMVLGAFANGYGETIQRLSGIHAGNLRPPRPAAASVFKIAAERVYFVEADLGLLDCALRYSRLQRSPLPVDHRFIVSVEKIGGGSWWVS